MKPRRENGSSSVSPIKSDLGAGLALIFLLLDCLAAQFRSKRRGTQVTCLRGSANKKLQGGGIKNKAVDAVCRQRPCQPRKLKLASAFRCTEPSPGFVRMNVS